MLFPLMFLGQPSPNLFNHQRSGRNEQLRFGAVQGIASLSEPRDTIEEVIEPYLIQLGLVARTARGRCLNGPAWAHLGLPQPKGQGGLFDGK